MSNKICVSVTFSESLRTLSEFHRKISVTPWFLETTVTLQCDKNKCSISVSETRARRGWVGCNFLNSCHAKCQAEKQQTTSSNLIRCSSLNCHFPWKWLVDGHTSNVTKHLTISARFIHGETVNVLCVTMRSGWNWTKSDKISTITDCWIYCPFSPLLLGLHRKRRHVARKYAASSLSLKARFVVITFIELLFRSLIDNKPKLKDVTLSGYATV